MITPQYTYDNTGNKTGVFIAIEDWDQLTQIPGVSELSRSANEIPEWQVDLGRKELKKVADNTAGLMEWDEAKKLFRI